MSLKLLVLGANSALPRYDRFSSAFVLVHEEKSFLIDAGEGCQMKMDEFKVKKSKISNVFISHLHGDHLYGLPGFITSLNLNGHLLPLCIWGPAGIKKYLEAVIEFSHVHMNFDLEIREIEENRFHQILDLGDLVISAFPLKHKVPNYGYLFQEKNRALNIKPEMITKYSLSFEEIRAAKKGKDLERKNEIIRNEQLTYIKEEAKSFAYCSDTAYDPSIIPHLIGVNALYHEATYMEDLKDQARERTHSTAKEAASIALQSGVERLLLGHYSSRYESLEPLLEEAKEVFVNSELALEGMHYII